MEGNYPHPPFDSPAHKLPLHPKVGCLIKWNWNQLSLNWNRNQLDVELGHNKINGTINILSQQFFVICLGAKNVPSGPTAVKPLTQRNITPNLFYNFSCVQLLKSIPRSKSANITRIVLESLKCHLASINILLFLAKVNPWGKTLKIR